MNFSASLFFRFPVKKRRKMLSFLLLSKTAVSVWPSYFLGKNISKKWTKILTVHPFYCFKERDSVQKRGRERKR